MTRTKATIWSAILRSVDRREASPRTFRRQRSKEKNMVEDDIDNDMKAFDDVPEEERERSNS